MHQEELYETRRLAIYKERELEEKAVMFLRDKQKVVEQAKLEA